MRYIGLDLGEKTLGISISNGIIANNYKTLRHDNEYESLVLEVFDIVKEEKIDKIVLGYPKNMDNSIGKRAEITLDFKNKLEEKIGIEVVLEDERLTSKLAHNFMIKEDLSRKKRKERVDGMASVIILQSYLDRKVN